jgi:hypothetical protein
VDVMVAEKMAEFSHLDRAPKYWFKTDD